MASKRPLRWNSTRDRRPSIPGDMAASQSMEATASIRRMSSVSHSLDMGYARTKSEGVSKLRKSAACLMPLAVRQYRLLEGRWAVPCSPCPRCPRPAGPQ